jgi:hypothetical protein
MSTPDIFSSLGALTTGDSVPAINPATEPANIRSGGAKAQQAYATALQFEQVLVNQLTQQLTSSADLTGDSSDDGSGDGSTDGTDSSSLLGSGPAASEYAQLLPGTLTSSIMGNGGLGNLADTLAAAIDPAINDPAAAGGATATGAAGSAPTGGPIA